MTYAAPLKVTIRLTIYDKDPDTGAKNIRDIKEQEMVFFGDIPLMTENGTFVINGTERVDRQPVAPLASGRVLRIGQQPPAISCRKLFPYRGSWVEIRSETTPKNILYALRI